jgi:exopolyphosphatase/guanosine-5'-triphosphate,3'-diphosphate pyrophosphatase
VGPIPEKARVLGAIDVGTNAARLEFARARPGGVLETFHYERAPIRPGEGVFESGGMGDLVADQLVATMQTQKARSNGESRGRARSYRRMALQRGTEKLSDFNEDEY